MDAACGPLTKDLAEAHAKASTLLIMAIDKLLLARFGTSWVQAVRDAGITWWLIAALDPDTSRRLGAMGITQCFNAPVDHSRFQGVGKEYQWGSHHWHDTTWKKVHVVRAVYDLGFHVLHSDADVTWFRDPLPWLSQQVLAQPLPHAVFATDSLSTSNGHGDEGFEAGATPHFGLNTGVYFVRQWPQGSEMFATWLDLHPKDVGHDQDAFNILARGRFRAGDETLPAALVEGAPPRSFWAAMHNTTALALFPVTLVGNSYTYVAGQVHKKLGVQPLAVHWVWTGGNSECKIANMRDAVRYVDPPVYYTHATAQGQHAAEGTPTQPLMLLSMDLDVPELPPGFNEIEIGGTEIMIQFHLAAANHQLQQAYWGILAAAALGRTWLLPAFQCFCTKNWYMTQACRINGEPHTSFPYTCAVPDLLRARKLATEGIQLPKLTPDGAPFAVHVREHTFLDNPRTPEDIKRSRLVIQPAGDALPAGSITPDLLAALPAPAVQQDGSALLEVPWPLNAVQLARVVEAAAGGPWRVVHLTNATRIVGAGFPDAAAWAAFDLHVVKVASTWCCRSPPDQAKFNRPNKEQLILLPESRRQAQAGAGDVTSINSAGLPDGAATAQAR